MAQLSLPQAPKEYATQYHNLLGVDYQADQTEVDRRRSPDLINMISDFGGNPVKRDGYRRVGDSYSAIVSVDSDMYGVYASQSVLTVVKLTLTGYEFAAADTSYANIAIGTIKGAFAYKESIYVIATKALVSFNTETKAFKWVGTGAGMMSIGAVGETAPVYSGNIPLTVYDLLPNGTGGKAYYDKNVFSIYQTYEYKGDGTATEYVIPNYSKIGTYVKAEVKDANGDWQTQTVTVGTSEAVIGKTLDGTGTETNNIVAAKVTFATAPSAPVIAGQGNVRITFAPYSTEEPETGVKKGYYNESFKALLSSNAITFESNRMFISERYKVYYSNVSDPFTISDLAWFDVDSEVMCFSRTSNYLAIVTKDNGRSTIFLASETTRTVDSETNEKETYFTVKASNAGVGAIAPKCMATMSDEPLFLSRTGVFGILSNYLSEKYVVNRSTRINRRLCKEPNLETAVGISLNDYFYIAINGRMYILDGRHKESDKAGNKPFEAYFFEGLPDIKSMYIANGKMFFCDEENTYTWNDDLTDIERYYDDAYLKTATSVAYQLGESNSEVPTGEWLDTMPEPVPGMYLWYRATYDDFTVEDGIAEVSVGDKKLTGEPVRARWSTVFDDDGAPQRLKTLMKKGSVITIVPHYRSGCEITLIKDGDKYEYLGSFDSDMQSFERIDFSRFTFSSNAVAYDEFTRKKVKKYKRLQIRIENNKAEPFGLTQITKTYTYGNYAKR